MGCHHQNQSQVQPSVRVVLVAAAADSLDFAAAVVVQLAFVAAGAAVLAVAALAALVLRSCRLAFA